MGLACVAGMVYLDGNRLPLPHFLARISGAASSRLLQRTATCFAPAADFFSSCWLVCETQSATPPTSTLSLPISLQQPPPPPMMPDRFASLQRARSGVWTCLSTLYPQKRVPLSTMLQVSTLRSLCLPPSTLFVFLDKFADAGSVLCISRCLQCSRA